MFSQEQQEKISKEFNRLKDLCYLDHAGATLYAESQIQAVARDLCENVYGNPHSLSTTSKYVTDIVDQIRYRVLRHFNTDTNEYSVIFTSGATQSLKLVAESFDWKGSAASNQETTFVNGTSDTSSYGTFMYLQDNHTSVLGMRELAAAAGATIQCLSHEEAFERLQDHTVENPTSAHNGNSLFVYPAQCNFSGVKYPLSWVSRVQSGALRSDSKWFCLLDAASFVSTNPLDLSEIQPDFVCLSFYKMFGYPTGLGALLVRNSSADVLTRNYFGGGTVLISLSSHSMHVMRQGLSERFEDGTIPFLSIIALQHGFDALERLTGGMAAVATHTFSLAEYLFHYLLTLCHADGSPAAKLYCDTDYSDVSTQGNIVNFNMLRSSGEYVGFMEVLNMANLHGIQLRTGCFCNPGACQRHLGLSDGDIKSQFEAGHVCGDDKDLVNGQPTGSVRVSFGYMSTKNDVDRLIEMLVSCFVRTPPVKKIPDWWCTYQRQYLYKFHIKSSSVISSEVTVKSEAKLNGFVPKISRVNSDKRELMQGACMTLRCIYVYPVKSCGAMKVNSWAIGPRGFLYDREWMVVTSAGVCLTQKQDTQLCLVRPSIDLGRGLLFLQFPGMSDISVPLDTPVGSTVETSLCQSKVCGDRVQGWDCGDDVATWLSAALGRNGLRLVRQWKNDTRLSKVNYKSAGKHEKSVLSLSNQAQFLLLNMGSVQWLSDQIDPDQADLDMDNLVERFRSNLVVEGSQAFNENEWTHVQIGNIKFKMEGPCTRCQMVCIDQSTGEKTREPLRTLAAALHGKMRFGVYLSHQSEGNNVKISIGDKVTSFQLPFS